MAKETHEFQAETKQLLDLMVHSIYTNHEIFLRELISNASDAIDKLHYQSLTNGDLLEGDTAFEIHLTPDADAHTLTISDNGLGMNKQDLMENLGTIAQSGTKAFLEKLKESQDADSTDKDLIGQFGVGFYSAFMVADKVTVVTRKAGEEQAYKWESTGDGEYSLEECQKPKHGTTIILSLGKDFYGDDSEENYTDKMTLQSLVKKYSDYIRYPIRMDMTKSRRKETENADKDAAPEYEEYVENETLNSMVPLWRKNKSELTDADYNTFYKEKFFDYNEPLLHIHTKSEGTATFNALLYIPSKAPYDYYTKEYEKGLQLYSSGVMIMEKCADLLPDYFSFVKGLVDSEDLSLNISRELLQHDRQLKIIAKALEKSIRNELTKLLKNDRAAYEKFFEAFGLQLKFGVYNGYGMNKDALKDLLLFYSSSEKKPVTLAEYVSRMKEDQTCIYYATGENIARIDHLPQTELVKDKGFEILYLTENVDEFAIKMLMNYEGKEFKSVSAGDLDLETEEEKKEIEEKSKEHADLFNDMQKALEGKVKSVRLSQRLKSHPVCLTSEGALSLEMEKVLNAMPTDQKVQADRVLEINPEHPIFAKLVQLQKENPDKLKAYAKLLYDQALLIEGMSIEDPVAFSNQICELMA